jgi:outer membrane protein assembly factor BamA
MIEEELQRVIRPAPNQRIGPSRPRLWMYFAAGEPRGRGLRYLMRNRFGRPPVLMEQVDPERSRQLIENRLFNMGYFDGSASYQVHTTPRTASVQFLVHLQPPYILGTLYPAEATNAAARQVNALLEGSLLKPGRPYRLDELKKERDRLDREMKRLGYFYFHPDYLIFLADTMQGSRTVDLHLRIKHDTPPQALMTYRVGNIRIQADYLSDPAGSTTKQGGLSAGEGITLFDSQDQFRPGLFRSVLSLEPGSLYNLDAHDRSLNRLMGLGVFRFINFRFQEPAGLPDGDEGVLDLRILLSPAKKLTLAAEVRGVSKSNNFAGPGFDASFTNNNLLGGAERLHINVDASYEALLGRQPASASAWEAGLGAELVFPRFVVPFFRPVSDSRFLPRTSFQAGWRHLNRSDAFSLNSWQLQYGFSWNRSQTIHQKFHPVVINLFSLNDVSQDLEGLLAGDLLMRRGLFEQYIIGSQYSWLYNSQQETGDRGRNDLYLNLNLDLSGNLAWIAAGALSGSDQAKGRARTLWGHEFSQYTRADMDARYYLRARKGGRLAMRLVAGAGFPYGNSDYLPYVKQFYIGGVNSIRAFQPRTLGPGAYVPPDSLSGGFNPYHSGEIKLEASLEYRFGITGMLRGAVFADAGNIWTLKEHENTPGGAFSWDGFFRQIALGSGAGLRLDATFFVLRLDVAFPLADPRTERQGYLEPVRPLSKNWRRDKLVFSLAIGYPF